MERSIKDVNADIRARLKARREKQNVPSDQWGREEYVGLRAGQPLVNDQYNRYDGPEDNFSAKQAERVALRRKAGFNSVGDRNNPNGDTMPQRNVTGDFNGKGIKEEYPEKKVSKDGKKKILGIRKGFDPATMAIKSEEYNQNIASRIEPNKGYYNTTQRQVGKQTQNNTIMKAKENIIPEKKKAEVLRDIIKLDYNPIITPNIGSSLGSSFKKDLNTPLIKKGTISGKNNNPFSDMGRYRAQNAATSLAGQAALGIKSKMREYQDALNYVNSKQGIKIVNQEDINKYNKALDTIRNYK